MFILTLCILWALRKTSSTGANCNSQPTRKNFKNNAARVGIIATTRASTNLDSWIKYHRAIGISYFFIALDAREVPPVLRKKYQRVCDVTLYTAVQIEAWRSKSEILGLHRMQKHINKPICGVDRVFVQQALSAEFIIYEILHGKLGLDIDWLFHIDTDELIYSVDFKDDIHLGRLLALIPKSVGRIILPNYEAVPEKLSNTDSFVDVTLFKRSQKHIDAEIYSKYKDAFKRDNPRNFLGYTNGKSAARVLDDLRPVGVHNFEHIRSRGLKQITLNESMILHYAFTDYSRVMGRFSQCDCPKEFTHKCKRLPFDMELAHKFDELYSSPREEELQKWYEARVVVSEPDSAYATKFLKLGMLTRITLPSTIIQ